MLSSLAPIGAGLLYGYYKLLIVDTKPTNAVTISATDTTTRNIILSSLGDLTC